MKSMQPSVENHDTIESFIDSIVKFTRKNPYHNYHRADNSDKIVIIARKDDLQDEQAHSWEITLKDIEKSNSPANEIYHTIIDNLNLIAQDVRDSIEFYKLK